MTIDNDIIDEARKTIATRETLLDTANKSGWNTSFPPLPTERECRFAAEILRLHENFQAWREVAANYAASTTALVWGVPAFVGESNRAQVETTISRYSPEAELAVFDGTDWRQKACQDTIIFNVSHVMTIQPPETNERNDDGRA